MTRLPEQSSGKKRGGRSNIKRYSERRGGGEIWRGKNEGGKRDSHC